MAVQLNKISEWLKKSGIQLLKDDNEVIAFIAGSRENRMSYFIRARDGGKIFNMQMQLLDDSLDTMNVKDHRYLNVLLPQLLSYNYETKFGTWEFDPSDGDIRLAVEIPLEDAVMTEKQLERIMSMMLGTSEEYVTKIKSILATGEVPLDDGADELISAFTKFLASKSSSSSSSDGI